MSSSIVVLVLTKRGTPLYGETFEHVTPAIRYAVSHSCDHDRIAIMADKPDTNGDCYTMRYLTALGTRAFPPA